MVHLVNRFLQAYREGSEGGQSSLKPFHGHGSPALSLNPFLMYLDVKTRKEELSEVTKSQQ